MLVLALVGFLQVGTALPAEAASRAGDDTPSLNESWGCGTAGVRPPLATTSGGLPPDFVAGGPWGDLLGRTYDQVRPSLVSWTVPMSGEKTVLVHARALPAFQQVSANLAAEAAKGRHYQVDVAFGWNWRTVGGSQRLSHHAFGTAVDINPSRNPMTSELITDMPAWFVEAWTVAGFCWGGFWLGTKDAMHFSWMGPTATPGYGDRLPGYVPLTADGGFQERGFSGPTPIGSLPASAVAVLADRNRDGADDLYVLRWRDEGRVRVEVVSSVSDFRTVGIREDVTLGRGPSDTVLLLGDYTLTGRADLWVLDVSGSTLSLAIRSDASRFTREVARFDTPVTIGPGVELLLADHDGDWRPDLYVIRREGAERTRVEVWNGADGFQTRLVGPVDTPLGPTPDRSRWRFALGDWDLDTVPDLYALRDDGRLTVLLGSGSYQGTPQVPEITTSLPPGRLGVGDWDGDGRDDLYVLRGDGRLEAFLGGRPAGGTLTSWFQDDDLAPWDAGPECLGPGPCAQVGFVDRGGRFHLRHGLGTEVAGQDAFFFGNPGDVAFAGDWNCDGIDTPGLYRQADGFVYLRNSNTPGVADRSFFFGNPWDVPLVGDWNGDGCDTVSLYRRSEGRVYIINRLGPDGGNLGHADYSFFFGDSGDKPFSGDFDGDGIDTVGLHRESTGFVYLRNSNTQGIADLAFYYGDPGDALVTGDWNGDGRDSLAVYRPANRTWYFKLANHQGPGDHALRYGDLDAHPVAGVFGTRK